MKLMLEQLLLHVRLNSLYIYNCVCSLMLPGSNKIGGAITGAHEGVVFSVTALEDGSLMSGGGKDRLIKTWDLKEKSEVSSMEVITGLLHCRVKRSYGERLMKLFDMRDVLTLLLLNLGC